MGTQLFVCTSAFCHPVTLFMVFLSISQVLSACAKPQKMLLLSKYGTWVWRGLFLHLWVRGIKWEWRERLTPVSVLYNIKRPCTAYNKHSVLILSILFFLCYIVQSVLSPRYSTTQTIYK